MVKRIYTAQYTQSNPATATAGVPLPGATAPQVQSYQGGYTFVVDEMTQLDRFLTYGAETTSIYLGTEQKVKLSDALIRKLINAGQGPAVVEAACVVSEKGRNIRQEPVMYTLAVCATSTDLPTKRAAWANYRRAARTGYLLFMFMTFVNSINGGKSNRSLRTGLGKWYEEMHINTLVYQTVKYQSRTVEGQTWSHRDLLRIVHPNPGQDESRKALFHWIAKGWEGVGDAPHTDPNLQLVWAFERAKTATTAREIWTLITDYGLTREMVPTQWLTDKTVLTALLQNMPMGAMIRNLGSMTARGILDPMSNGAALVRDRLNDLKRIRGARLHPLVILATQRQYATGAGNKGKLTWTPNQQIVSALESAFYLAFEAYEPTGLRVLNAIDCSGSMDGSQIAGLGMTAREVAVVLAMVGLREPNAYCIGYTDVITDLPLTRHMSLVDAMNTVNSRVRPTGTDCSLPMRWAMERSLSVDAFVQLTDNQQGGFLSTRHPAQMLVEYRKRMQIPAYMVVAAMDDSRNTIGDPEDARTLNVAGASPALPRIIADFITGGAGHAAEDTTEDE